MHLLINTYTPASTHTGGNLAPNIPQRLEREAQIHIRWRSQPVNASHGDFECSDGLTTGASDRAVDGRACGAEQLRYLRLGVRALLVRRAGTVRAGRGLVATGVSPARQAARAWRSRVVPDRSR
jgi:hypothetical protein